MSKIRSRGSSVDGLQPQIINIGEIDKESLSKISEIITEKTSVSPKIKDKKEKKSKKSKKEEDNKENLEENEAEHEERYIIVTKDGKEIEARIKNKKLDFKKPFSRASLTDFLRTVSEVTKKTKIWVDDDSTSPSNSPPSTIRPASSSPSNSPNTPQRRGSVTKSKSFYVKSNPGLLTEEEDSPNTNRKNSISLSQSSYFVNSQNSGNGRLRKRSNSEPFLHSWDYSPLPLPQLSRTSSTSSSSSVDESPNAPSTSNNIHISVAPASPQSTHRNTFSFNVEALPGSVSPTMSRVTAGRPRKASWGSFLNEPDNRKGFEAELVTETVAEGKRVIVAASINYLVRSLITDMSVFDRAYVDSILMAHKLFIDDVEFLEKLFEIFGEEVEDKTTLAIKRNRIIHIIRNWIGMNDIRYDEKLVKIICNFADKLHATQEPTQITWSIQLKESLGASSYSSDFKVSPKLSPHLPKLVRGPSSSSLSNLVPKKIQSLLPQMSLSFSDVDPLEFAKHLTAGDWKLFRKIKPSELLQKAWSKEDKETHSPNLLKLIDRFNRTSCWIASEILLTANPKQRVTVIERCISLIKHLKDLHNYHGAWTVYSALNKGCIQGLRAEWKGVGRKYITILRSIDQLMDSRSNFKVYRETIKNLDTPFLPFEGIFLTDLTFNEENPNFIGELVNFRKVQILGDILSTIRNIQQSNGCPYQESILLKEYIKRAIILDEPQLLQVSQQISNTVHALATDKKKSVRSTRLRTYTN